MIKIYEPKYLNKFSLKMFSKYFLEPELVEKEDGAEGPQSLNAYFNEIEIALRHSFDNATLNNDRNTIKNQSSNKLQMIFCLAMFNLLTFIILSAYRRSLKFYKNKYPEYFV